MASTGSALVVYVLSGVSLAATTVGVLLVAASIVAVVWWHGTGTDRALLRAHLRSRSSAMPQAVQGVR